MSSPVAERARVICHMRLHSAVRTAAACLIVGGATLYGPKIISNQIKFSAFSYLTAIVIVSDVSLGDTIKGCWHACCATAQVVPLAVLGRRFIDPTGGMPVGIAAAAVAAAAFVVALPECTNLTVKRIAFGQIVLVCADAVVSEDVSDGFMHPVYVAASTALGALASVLAMVIPYPSLASEKVQRLCRVHAENASQRMNIYMRAFSAPDNNTKVEILSQAKPLSETGAKLLQSINILQKVYQRMRPNLRRVEVFIQEGIPWERPWRLFSKHKFVRPGDRLQSMELQMRGLEYSLSSSPPLPVQALDQEQLSNFLQNLSIRIDQKINQVTYFFPVHSKTEQESKEKPLLQLDQEWVYFYLFCMDMFLNDCPMHTSLPQTETELTIIKTWILKLPSTRSLEFAFKCSISLGLAMLFGLIFDRVNGCWAGLAIAISFVTGKQAVFTIANTRAQGTAMGSVYGVICCFIFHFEELRLLALVPWIIFTSFLRHSKMYGQTGGVSAAIGALLILGRKNYGAPNEFALARLTEVFIGLSAFVLVELFVQTTRASTLAKNHLSLTLCCLHDCLKERIHKFLELREKQRNLNYLVCEFRKYVEDAEMEPDFWYLPFRTSSYKKMVASLSNISDMLYFITYSFERLLELSETSNEGKEFRDQMNSELELLEETLRSSRVYLHKAHLKGLRTESQEVMDGKFKDLEAGELRNPENLSVLFMDNQGAERISEEEEDSEDKKRVRKRMIQYLGTIRFCINSLIKEINEIEICERELDQWEN